MDDVRLYWAISEGKPPSGQAPILFPVEMLEEAKRYAKERGLKVFPAAVQGTVTWAMVEVS